MTPTGQGATIPSALSPPPLCRFGQVYSRYVCQRSMFVATVTVGVYVTCVTFGLGRGRCYP